MKQVALLIESSRSYGRGLLKGVAAYARTTGRWALRHQEMSIDSQPPIWLKDWKGDGIIARIESEQMAEAIASLGIPAIDLRCSRKVEGIPQINTDDEAVIRLAVEHLRQRGMRRFAFCGFATADYSVRRLKLFRERLKSFGSVPEVYESQGPRNPTTMQTEQGGMLDHAAVIEWLQGLEKPIGLFASNDIRAQQVLLCCAEAGIAVPDDIALVGVDNDDVICSLCQPNLSSVELDTPKIGHAAATLLDSMMDGQPLPSDSILIPPKQVVVRGSSDIVAIEDRTVAAAYRYLREHACDGISVDDVVQQIPLSRRSLERRLRECFGKTPSELISEVRIAKMKQLLEETDFTHSKIARLTGFVHDEHMAVFFRKHVGEPPGRYRKNWRATHNPTE